uniref:Uncharacterized protein n=1 Tax=Plectus sambesii TaxID=2011161 RepID=A0A914UKR6_9BILA
MSCLTYGCSRRSVNLLDVSAKSSNSWEFVRVRSSTPKKNERQVHNREAAAKSLSDKKRTMERRQLSFSGNGFFGEDNPITPISPHATNSKPYGQIESLMPWQPPTTSPDKILDLSAERSDMSSFKREKQSGDMSSFKRENRSEKTTSALFEYEMGVI